MAGYLIAADQGTTSSRAVLFDENCRVVDVVQREFRQYYPKEGWVEHDPMEIYASQYGAINEVIAKNGVDPRAVRALGITNQRETAIVWDRETGLPVYNAIVWQCRRTAPICEELINRGLSGYIKDVTGLVIDAYFSATKIKWLLDNADGARRKAEEGRLMFGTVDSWLIYNMTGKSVHVTDRTNASRTMLYDIHNLCWSERLCGELGIPMSMLPEVKSSSEVYGYFNVSGVDIPIAGIAGDQQSALFGHQCFSAGSAKNTYGTGCFLLMNTGEKAAESRHGLITTIAATPKDSVQYALEGSVFTAGAVVQWMRDELELIKSAEETEALAMSVPDTGGVYLVPAFTGLGAPDWDMYARGTIVGLTRGTNKRHLARAGLESIAYQSDAVIRAMELDVGQRILALNVDGGASQNNFLMQFQSDISGLSIHRSNTPETTALGAVYLAGLAAGVFKDVGELEGLKKNGVSFTPKMPENERNARRKEYARAAERAAKWIVPEQ